MFLHNLCLYLPWTLLQIAYNYIKLSEKALLPIAARFLREQSSVNLIKVNLTCQASLPKSIPWYLSVHMIRPHGNYKPSHHPQVSVRVYFRETVGVFAGITAVLEIL